MPLFTFSKARTRFFKRTAKRPDTMSIRLTTFVLDWFYTEGIQYCALVVGLTTFALYGLIEPRYLNPLFILQSTIFFYFSVENILRIHKYGFINFWYVPQDVFKESNNRYNLAIALLSVVTFIVVISLGRLEDVSARAILFLPMLRIFCVVNQIRVLFLAILRSLYKIFWLSIFGALIFYFFAVCGIFLYAGAYQDFITYNRT